MNIVENLISALKRSKKCNIWWSQMTCPRGANWVKFSNKILSKKTDFRFKNMKKTESPKMTSKVLYELLIRSYERFKYFSRTWNLTISKSTSVNQQKCGHHGKINFNREKTQKCNIRWSQMTSPWVTNWGTFSKNFCQKNPILDSKIWKKLKIQKWTQKSSASS